MTGEMHAINEQGEDSNGDVWSAHAAIAKALGGTLEPFDVYQGPYILLGSELRVGPAPYAVPVPGACRLWLQTKDGELGQVYREDTDTLSEPFLLTYDESEHEAAIAAAQSLL